ncbi:hypothetical protein B6A10_04660 [Flavobacterium sp. L1I52]|uniref:Uncharacterized protein n=1 Tax=Flavobacterium pokkalii TaxID=1940408 RepID=A0ABR7UNZ9_9FLAO|nr:hypothetical protein [Flavobacterium pokkalii]MBD0724464.1 hypothetical protein [Flavobacterium pokkalii]
MERQDFWSNIDNVLKIHEEHILSNDQRKFIHEEEQKAYETNINSIQEIIDEFESKLKERNFWTEKQIDKKGFRFRFNKTGYYGPRGFSSQFHIAGPLVLGVINPTGDSLQSFYKNRLEDNVQIGCNFDKDELIKFIEKIILDFASTNNLIISKEQYDYLRNFKNNN